MLFAIQNNGWLVSHLAVWVRVDVKGQIAMPPSLVDRQPVGKQLVYGVMTA